MYRQDNNQVIEAGKNTNTMNICTQVSQHFLNFPVNTQIHARHTMEPQVTQTPFNRNTKEDN